MAAKDELGRAGEDRAARYFEERGFRILARNWRPDRIYIATATLNGRPLNTPFLHQADITSGGTLELTLSAQPTGWAQSAGSGSY